MIPPPQVHEAVRVNRLQIAKRVYDKLTGSGGIGRTFQGFSWLLADKLVTLGAALLVAIPIARFLGPTDFGLLTFVNSFVAIMIPLSSVGLENMVTRYLVERRDDQGLVMGTVLFIRKAVGVIVVALFGLYCLFGPFPDDRMRFFAFLTIAAAVAGNASIFKNWFSANHQLRALAIANTCKTLVLSAWRLLLIYLDAPLSAFIYTVAFDLGTTGLIAWFAYSRVATERLQFSISTPLARELLSKSWPLAISSLAAALYLKLDVILLTSMSSPAEAGLYGAAARLSEIWYFVPSLLMTAIFPTFLKIRRRGVKEYSNFLQDVLDVLAGTGMLLAIFVTFAAPLIISILYGPSFARAADILSIHIWAGVFIFMRAVLSRWLIAEDLYFFSLLTHGSGAIVNIALNLWLIPILGGKGAAISTLLSYSTSSYLSLCLSKKTRPMCWKMTLALFWPRRLPEVYNRLRLELKR